MLRLLDQTEPRAVSPVCAAIVTAREDGSMTLLENA